MNITYGIIFILCYRIINASSTLNIVKLVNTVVNNDLATEGGDVGGVAEWNELPK